MSEPPEVSVGQPAPPRAVVGGQPGVRVVLPGGSGVSARVGASPQVSATVGGTGGVSATVGGSGGGVDLNAVHWKGPWVAGTGYARNDLVTHNDRLWICVIPSSSVAFSLLNFTEIGAIHTASGTLQAENPTVFDDLVTLGYFQYAGGGSGTPPLFPSYTHRQATPATVWTVIHNLGFRPNVTVVDSGGTEMVGDLLYLDDNTVQLTFSAQFAGEAYLS